MNSVNHLRLFLFLVFFPTVVYAEQKIDELNSLKNIWEIAEKNSPGLKARSKQLESIQHSIDALPSWYKPTVHFEVGYTGAYNPKENAHGPLARFVAQWNLWDGGRSHYARLSGQQRGKVQKWQQIMLMMNLKKRIALLYFRIAHLQQLEIQYLQKDNHLGRLLGLIRPRLRIGRVGSSDMQEVKIQRLQLKIKRNTLKALAILMKKQLALLVGLGNKKPLKILQLSKQNMLADATINSKVDFTSLPIYKLSQAQLGLLKSNLEWTKRDLYWPSFHVETYGGYGPHVDSIDSQKPEIGLGFRFNIPLYSSRSRSSTLSAKKSEIMSRELDIKQSMLQSQMDFNLKSGEWVNIQLQQKEMKNVIKKLQKNLYLAYKDFSHGLKSPADMRASIDSFYESKRKYIDINKKWLGIESELYLVWMYSKSQIK